MWSEIITGPQEEHPWESECLLCLQRAMRKESSWEPSDHHKIWKDCKQIYDFTIWPRQRVCYSGVNILTNLTSNLCIHWIVRIHSLPVLAFSNCYKPPYKIKTKIKTSAWLTSLHSHAKSKIIQSFKFITKKKKILPPSIRSLLLSLNTEINACPINSCMHLDPLQSLIWKCLKHNRVKPCAI